MNKPGGTNWCHPGVSCRQLATKPARRPRNAKNDTCVVFEHDRLPGSRWIPGRKGDFFLAVGRPEAGRVFKRA